MPDISGPFLPVPTGYVSAPPLILELMRHPGLRIAELARRADLSPQTVHNIFRGRGRQYVSVYVADRLAIAMGVHPIVLWPDEWIADALDDEKREVG